MNPTPSVPTHNKMTGRTKAALWLLIGPTALLVAGFILFAAVNWVTTSVSANTAELDLFSTIANIVLFMMGTIGILSWLPGLIIGIILLATKPQQPAA